MPFLDFAQIVSISAKTGQRVGRVLELARPVEKLMASGRASVRLPAVLIASDGHHPVHPPAAVDIDSVSGLGGDDLAVDFVTERLGIGIVLTRRPQLAARAAERGQLGLVHVFACRSRSWPTDSSRRSRMPRHGPGWHTPSSSAR